jgi:hypothetical protein
MKNEQKKSRIGLTPVRAVAPKIIFNFPGFFSGLSRREESYVHRAVDSQPGRRTLDTTRRHVQQKKVRAGQKTTRNV